MGNRSRNLPRHQGASGLVPQVYYTTEKSQLQYPRPLHFSKMAAPVLIPNNPQCFRGFLSLISVVAAHSVPPCFASFACVSVSLVAVFFCVVNTDFRWAARCGQTIEERQIGKNE